MESSYDKNEDNPVIMESDKESISVDKVDHVIAPTTTEEKNVQQKTTSNKQEDLFAEVPPSQQRLAEETDGEQEVEMQEEERCKADDSRLKAGQSQKSEHYHHAVPENKDDCMAEQSSLNTMEAKANVDEEEGSVMEITDEGNNHPGSSSIEPADLQPMDRTSCDVYNKSPPAATEEDGCNEMLQTGEKLPPNTTCRGRGTAVAGNNSSRPKPGSSNFLSALNLQPRKRLSKEHTEVENGCSDGTKRSRSDFQNGVGPTVSMATAPATLTQLFRKEPDSVVQLLAAAIPMDSLSSLLREEHSRSSAQLKQLRERLEKAHQTVEVCSQQKEPLLQQIDAVTEKIQLKQQQLKDTREDLRQLSSQESDIKAKRDAIHSKCSELRRKLLASREALHQIQQLYANKRHAATKVVKAS